MLGVSYDAPSLSLHAVCLIDLLRYGPYRIADRFDFSGQGRGCLVTSPYWHIQDAPHSSPGRAPLRCGNCLHLRHVIGSFGQCTSVTARYSIGSVSVPRPVMVSYYCQAHEYRPFGGGL